MPTYSYVCENCQHSFDVFQRISESPICVCPKCQQVSVRRVIHGGAGIIFKGSGFYCTDYKHNSTPTSSPKNKSSQTTETQKSEQTQKTESSPTTKETKTA